MSRALAAQAHGTRRLGRIAATGLPALALILLVLLSLATGRYGVPFRDVLAVLGERLLGLDAASDPTVRTVVLGVRLPRVAAALVVGAALSAAGATYQGLFRNPLVSPDILGVSAGASLGAVLGIFLALPVAAIQGLAFAGGLAAVAAVYAVGGAVRRHDPVLTLVLAGVAVGAVLGRASRSSRYWPTPTTSCRPSPTGCSAASPRRALPTSGRSCRRSCSDSYPWWSCAGA